MLWVIKQRSDYLTLRSDLITIHRKESHRSCGDEVANAFNSMVCKTVNQLDSIFGVGYIQKYCTEPESMYISEKNISRANRILKRLEHEYLIKKLAE